MNNELLLIPGPTPVLPEILEIMSKTTVSHVDPRMVQSYKNSLKFTRDLFSCDGEVFVIAGSGTLMMEMALVNTVAANENILVLSQGYFGDRFLQLAASFNINADVIAANWGERVSVELVKEQLKAKKYKAVTITHVDTSTGVEADLETLVPIIKESGALAILDGVCATAGIEENMSKDYGNGAKIDVVLTGSQKAIGVPPGLGIIAFSSEALKVREKLGNINAYYADIKRWIPIMHDPTKYYATPSVNMVWAYEKAMEIIFNEGLQARYERHRKFGRAVRAALKTFDMHAVACEECAAATMSCIKYPQGIVDADFRKACYANGLVLAGGLGEFKGKAFRIGHMGNTTTDQLIRAFEIIANNLTKLGHEVDATIAIQKFKDVLN
ncbi:alanine--glyoxylate aminotransferase family protein [Clostridium sp. 'deep sea']|uniref:pyridoxal-phosphate-dependent aminotransferase family protein n=1 Tax=Clostridium sp. 'deep sea' TaxID=2779445 RepID=UPI00189680EF|nr:alanine--glyoxylate aminotransferase family protein [Clostridium sp. 'deep sea']QOR35952.1 alanine--glyoxylate aminotransferase family protein [Clostridium sp. 'deep sea']